MLKYSKAIAANTDLETSQAFISSSENPDNSEQLYFAFLISAAGDNAFTTVRQSAADVADNFFGSQEDISNRLNESLNFLKEALLGLEELQILLAVWKTGVLYLVSSGNQKAYIYRKEQLIPLIAPQMDDQLISGFLEPGDKLLFINHPLYRYLSDSEYPDRLENFAKVQTEDLEEEVNMAMMYQTSSPPLSAILVDNQKDEEPEPEVEEAAATPIPEATPFEISSRLDLPNLLQKLKDILPKGSKPRLVLIGAVILIALLLIGLSKKNSADQQKNLQFQNLLSDARSSFDNAKNLKDSNPDQAKNSLVDAEGALDQALKIKPGDSNALDFKKQLDGSSNDILKVTTLTNWPIFLDLNLIKTNFSADRLSLSVGEILLLDKKQTTLVEISLSKKTNNILGGPGQLGQASQASLNGTSAFVYSKDKGVVKIDTDSLKAQVVAKPDSDWGDIVDISGFAGNFYLLDSVKNQIWKYSPAASGYSDKSTYIRDGVSVDFSGAERFLIDSSIWVLKSGSEIDKYTSGTPDSFSVGGLDKNLKNVTSFFVSSDTDNVYLLDSGNSRVVVLKKSGQYVSQLTGDKFKDAQDFVVDETGKKLYLLENNKIYQIDLP